MADPYFDWRNDAQLRIPWHDTEAILDGATGYTNCTNQGNSQIRIVGPGRLILEIFAIGA